MQADKEGAKTEKADDDNVPTSLHPEVRNIVQPGGWRALMQNEK